MKLTTLIILLALLQVSAASVAQKVTLKATNATLSSIFQQVRQQTGYDFAYGTQDLEHARPVTIDIKNTDLKDALDLIFSGQPLDYTIEDKSVVVSAKQPNLLDKLKSALSLDKIDVHGKVIADDGQPLAGATINVIGTNNSTITDAQGEFTLKNVAPDGIVTVTFVGFEKKEVKAATELGVIKMTAASNPLDQVQVIAYGQQTQRLSVGNVTTVTAKTIEEQPVNNPLLALEGQVSGLVVTQQNGIPGGNIKIQIQGQNSITQGNSPFFVVDGVPYTSSLLSNVGGVYGPTPSANPFSYINPDDIESISVLKDADATAIYGSRAANGAILITTKKGKAGEAKVEINLQNGFGQVPHFVDLMNTQQYLQMRDQALVNDGLNSNPSITTTPTDNNYDINGLWNTSSYTNWQKTLIGGTSHYDDFNGTVSGGSANIQYLVGGTFHRETTVFPGDFFDNKGGLHFSLNSQSNNKRFTMQLTGNYLVDNTHLPLNDLTVSALQLAPDAPALYNADGTLNWAPNPTGTNSWTNPLASNLIAYQNNTNNLVSNLVFKYELLPGLNISSSLGYTNLSANDEYEHPLTSVAPSARATSIRYAFYGNTDINSWIVEPQINYKKVISKGTLSALLGSTITQQNSSFYGFEGTGYNSDQVLDNIASAATITSTAVTNSTYKYNALFGRLNYTWADRYIVDLNARRDGSSRFGPANEFHNFWSAAAGWIFSEEKMVKDVLPLLSYGKLRASYGTTGNDQIGDYKYLSLYNPNSATVPYQGISTLSPNGLTNPYLQWESTRKFEAGLDVGFWNNRVLLGAAYFDKRSSNELLSYALPEITGFQSIAENFPATVANFGWEFNLNTTNIQNKLFSWKSSFNLTIPTNRLVSFPNIAISSLASTYVVGQPIFGFVKTYHYLGVNPATGAYTFSGINGPTSTPNFTTDANTYVNTSPKFYGGLQNSLSYKSIQLDFLLQFVKQMGPNFFNASVPAGYKGINQLASVLNNPWTTVGQQATTERYNSNLALLTTYSDYKASDAGYGDASFVRLKNVSLSWSLPSTWSRSVGFENVRLFAQGENLLTFTGYKGLDPESLNNTSLPPLRTIAFGVKLGL